MRQTVLLKVVPATLAVLGGLILLLWWGGGRGTTLKERVPGLDRADGAGGEGGSSAKWDGKLVVGAAKAPAGLAGIWPWFRGPNLDGISPENTPLAKTWPAGGPPVLWGLDVGEGFAAPAIWKGRVFFTDYDHKGQADALRCLSLADGQEIWRYTYAVKVKRNHGMSRTIPAVTDKHVVSLGPKCHVICVDVSNGELRWKMDLVRDFNTEVPPWYAGQCPLVEGGRLILGTGGDALLVTVDLESGKVVWKSPNPSHWQMTHSSITPIEFKGKRMYVYCASGGVAGVAADNGQILWQTPDWKISIANIPSPLYVGDGRIFLSGGYNAGSMMIQLKEANGKYSVETLFKLKPAVFGSAQQTPILFQNHILGVRPDGQLVCLDLSGKTIWESGAANKYGLGPYMIAGGLILAMNDDGLLTLAEASISSFRKLAQAKVLAGPDAWGPMALADGRLILRDMNRMICLDVAAR
jgi:outer membrane protein assembly factor BamB